MNSQTTSSSTANGESTLHDLFALSDEQILEIEPEAVILSLPAQAGEAKNLSSTESASNAERSKTDSAVAALAQNDNARDVAVTSRGPRDTSHNAPVISHQSLLTSHDSPEPPPWLAAQMKDPWSGEEAREFWNGVQQARTEAVAYRAAIASPEDARALKELYPGGVDEARAAADRARLLDEVDRAYFGGAGNSPEQTSATRAQLAQQLLREDPAALREMVETAVRILQEATAPQNQRTRSIASLVQTEPGAPTSSVVAQLHPEHSPGNAVPLQRNNIGEHGPMNTSVVGAQHAAPLLGNPLASDAHLSAYAPFERAANEDLERSVGSTIERTLEQALPVAQPILPALRNKGAVRGPDAQPRVPALRERLGATIRQEVERALQGDRQLGEQVAEILASRRFDNDTRAQVVRLIGERAQQLVPGAAKRVLNEWTQTTLATHRSRAQHGDTSASRADITPAAPEPRTASSPARTGEARADARRLEASATKAPRRVDYRKFSDEQILDMG